MSNIYYELKRFFFSNRWGWIALLSLLLSILYGYILVAISFSSQLVIFFASSLSLAGLLLLFLYRERLWLADLASSITIRDRVKFPTVFRGPSYNSPLLLCAGFGFVIFTVAGGHLLLRLTQITLNPAAGPLTLSNGAILLIAVAFVIQTLSCGAYAVYAYGLMLIKTGPRPIFLDHAKHAALVTGEAKLRIQLKLRKAVGLVIEVETIERLADAGLLLRLQSREESQETTGGFYLNVIRHWQVRADKWGRISDLKQMGPDEYITDPKRVYEPPPVQPALAGELISLESTSPATIEDAIILAVMAAAYRR